MTLGVATETFQQNDTHLEIVLPNEANYYLWGWSGHLNTGDDVLLAVAAWGLRRFMGGQRLFMDSDISGVASHSSKVLTSEPANGKLPGATRVRRWLFRRQSNAFVLTGGNLLSHCEVDNLLKDRFWVKGNRASLAMGVSVGPFKSIQHEHRTCELLKRMRYVAVRDNFSAQWSQANLLETPVIAAGDLAVLLPEIETTVTAGALHSTGAKKLAISLLPRESLASSDGLTKDIAFAGLLGQTIASLMNDLNVSVVVMSLCRNPRYDDLPLSRAFANAFPRHKVELIEHDGDPHKVFAAMNKCTHCLSMRLHGAVLAYTASLPILMLSYHQKCIEFGKMISLNADDVIDATQNNFDISLFEKRLALLMELSSPNYSLPLSQARTLALRNFQPELL